MNHLIISRQYPPASNSGGGIATYLGHIAELLAARGETVHVIGQMWPGAQRARETRVGGRLTIHRVAPDHQGDTVGQSVSDPVISKALQHSALPYAGFLWRAAILAESLIETAGIDVVEAQEYEAPTYALMLRRAVGLGPRRRVPILVHLHTPTEFVYNLNGWEQDLREHAPTMQRERAVIRAADALVCPSRFLARIAESHYQLEPGAVEVIPYPMGDFALQARDENTWREGTICYAGRLEPRKGITEWIDAAAAVAKDAPAHFVLIGADTSSPSSGVESMRAMLRARIPPAVRSRFSFCGEVPRGRLLAHLARARMAAIPSRWENFPYTCIEAMASGLPVLVSPTGGMGEMVEDGRTGWVAAGSDARSLEIALRCALATPPSVLSDMGAAAAAAIRVMCDNDGIGRRQLDFRRRVVQRGCRQAPDVSQMLAPLSDEPADPGLPRAGGTWVQGATMTPLDLLRASRSRQLAVVRRALANPRYVAQWVAWHGRRAIDKVSRKLFR